MDLQDIMTNVWVEHTSEVFTFIHAVLKSSRLTDSSYFLDSACNSTHSVLDEFFVSAHLKSLKRPDDFSLDKDF